MAEVELDRLIQQALSAVVESGDCSADCKRQLGACLRRTLYVACKGECEHLLVDLDRQGMEKNFARKPCCD